MVRVGYVESTFEKDVFNDEALRNLVQSDPDAAQQLYAALCNVKWTSSENEEFFASWRYAAALVADLVNQGEVYLDYYCSGGEGHVAPRIEKEINKLGWKKELC